MSKNELADVLGIDPQRAAELPERALKQAFFEHLASEGITVDTEDRAMRLLQASDQLEHKQAAAAQASDPVNKALDSLLGKTAAAPQQRGPQFIHAQKTPDELRRLASQKTASILDNPLDFAGMLTAFTS